MNIKTRKPKTKKDRGAAYKIVGIISLTVFMLVQLATVAFSRVTKNITDLATAADGVSQSVTNSVETITGTVKESVDSMIDGYVRLNQPQPFRIIPFSFMVGSTSEDGKTTGCLAHIGILNQDNYQLGIDNWVLESVKNNGDRLRGRLISDSDSVNLRTDIGDLKLQDYLPKTLHEPVSPRDKKIGLVAFEFVNIEPGQLLRITEYFLLSIIDTLGNTASNSYPADTITAPLPF